MVPAEEFESRTSATSYRWATVLLSILAFGLRAYRLTAQSLWSDEDITLDRAGQPLAEMLAGLPVEQAPGYYVLMRFWTQLAGDSDLALRFPSLLAGVLAVPLAGLLGTRLADRDTGHIMMLIVAMNPFLVYYGQEARMYALLFTLSLAILVILNQAERTGRSVWWIACGVLVAAILYTHYYGALIVFALVGAAFFDLRDRDRDRLRGWAMAGLTATLLFGPWLPRALGVLQFEGWRSALPLSEALMAHLTDWFAGRSLPDGHPAIWIPLAALLHDFLFMLMLASILFLARRLLSRIASDNDTGVIEYDRGSLASRFLMPRGLTLLTLPLLAYVLILLRTANTADGWSRATVDYDPRYAMAALPGLFLLVARGTSPMGWFAGLPVYLASRLLPNTPRGGIDRWIRETRYLPSLVGALLILAAAWPGLHDLYTNPASQKQDYRGFVAAVEAEASHEDTVLLLDGPNYGLARRYEIEDSPVKIVNLHSSGNLERGPEARAEYAAELSSIFPHVWLAEDGARLGDAKAWLDANTYPVSTAGYQDITLRRYYRPVLAYRDPAQAFSKDLENSLGVGSFDHLAEVRSSETVDRSHPDPAGVPACSGLTLQSVAAGEMLPIALRCSISEPGGREYKLSVRLVHEPAYYPSNQTAPIASVDRRPVNWTRPTSTWQAGEIIVDRHALPVPDDLDPGGAGVEVLVYEESEGLTVDKLIGRLTIEPRR